MKKSLSYKTKRLLKKRLPAPVKDAYWRLKNFFSSLRPDKNSSAKKFELDIHLAEHCNLNCANCSHFSSIAGEQFIDIDSFKNDCARIADLDIDNIEVRLMGGEPLLHPRLTEVLKISRECFHRGNIIEIVTNGILLAKQPDAFWEACNENKIRVFISSYPIKLNMEQIEKTADRFSVEVIVSHAERNDIWRIRPLDLTGSQNTGKSFSRCGTRTCHQLKDGKIFPCATAAYINHFNAYFNKNLTVTENDFISIYENHTAEEILDFLSRPIPFCRYCVTGKKTRFYRKWALSNKDITEWVLEGVKN